MYVFKASKDNRVSFKYIAGEQNSPISNMATIFAKNICDTISNNMKLMLIIAETEAALNLQEETGFFPQDSVHGCNVFVARWHQYNIWVHLLLESLNKSHFEILHRHTSHILKAVV